MPPDATATETSVAAMTSQRAASTRSANRFANGSLARPCLSTELESLIVSDHGGGQCAKRHGIRSPIAKWPTRGAGPVYAESRPARIACTEPAESESALIKASNICGHTDWRSTPGKVWSAGTRCQRLCAGSIGGTPPTGQDGAELDSRHTWTPPLTFIKTLSIFRPHFSHSYRRHRTGSVRLSAQVVLAHA